MVRPRPRPRRSVEPAIGLLEPRALTAAAPAEYGDPTPPPPPPDDPPPDDGPEEDPLPDVEDGQLPFVPLPDVPIGPAGPG